MDDRRHRVIGRVMARVAVDKETGCWNWTGPDSGNGRGGGYGRMSLDGQTVAVHLVMFTHFYGYLPSKKQVDHKCNNRRCCNPEHLQLVTPKKNQMLKIKRRKS